MVTEKTLNKFGFVKDINNSKLKEVFKDSTRLKKIHIDIYPEHPLVTSSSPFTLLLRTIEKNATVSNDDSRLILKRNDEFETYFLNVLFSDIESCLVKTFEDCFEFILNIQNIHYRIIVLN